MVNQNKQVKILIILLFILNMADTIFTLKVTEGLSTMELNPLLAPLIEIPTAFVTVKILIGLVCCLILFRHLLHRLVKRLISIPIAVYLTVMIIHLMYFL